MSRNHLQRSGPLVRLASLILVLQFVLMGAAPGQSTWHVAKSGAADGAGSAVDPFNNIQRGIDAASAGDLVLVGPGTYFEELSLPADVMVRSTDGAEATIIRRRGTEPTVSLTSGSTSSSLLEGFTITQERRALVGARMIIDSAIDFAEDAKAADLDGDGDLDLVAASRNGDSIYRYEQMSGGAFGPAVLVSNLTDGAISIALADLDGDGDPDIASASITGGTVEWHENRLDEVTADFAPRVVVSSAVPSVRELVVADVNGDGDLDLLTASAANDTIAWYENTGGGVFGPQNVIDSSVVNADGLAAADLDGDGDQDVLSVSPDTNLIAWHENTGAGIFAPKATVTALAASPRAVTASDLDGDGDQDVLLASFLNDTIAWCENLGGGAFGALQVISNLADEVLAVHAADLDADGDIDVFSASRADDKVAWYENLGGGVFGGQNVITDLADGASHVTTADLDGDGELDVLGTSRFDDTVAWYPVDAAPTVPFGPKQVISSSATGAISVDTADFDGDGDLDVLRGSQANDRIMWHENTGAGTFGPAILIGIEDLRDARAADLDGDGDQDVMAISSSGAQVLWYANDGSGGFGPKNVISNAANNGKSVFDADLDGDGDLDVLSASAGNGRVAWYENLGSGAFGPQNIIDSLAGANQAHPADLDGDGDLDVLVCSETIDTVRWYPNLGGSFGPPVVITTATAQPRAVTTADLDGDGDLDVLSASRNDNTVAWFENLGGGAFGALQAISTSTNGAFDVETADIDGDGDPDILTAAVNSAIASWHENLGGGSFGPAQTITLSDGSFSVHAADVDGDGNVDAFTAGNNTIAWYKGWIADPSATTGNGAGVLADSGAAGVVRNCIVRGIERVGDGGGVEALGGSTSFEHCVIAGNSASTGGGVWLGAGTVNLEHVTISGNAAGGSGGVSVLGGIATITDSIIWGNSGTQASGGAFSLGITFSDVTGIPNVLGNIDADPLFVSAMMPGAGPMGDFDLSPGSPCIGVASDFSDMGARQTPAVPTYPGTNEDLSLITTVNGAGSLAGIHPTAGGDALTFRMVSPNGTFVGLPPILLAQGFVTGAPPTPSFPGILVDVFATPAPFVVLDGTVPGPFGFVTLPPEGIELGATMPMGFTGLSVLLQLLVITPTAANGIFASSHGAEIRGL